MRTVRLTTCNNSYEAYLIKNALENEGIGCAIHNENMTNIFGGIISAFSGVDIFVYEDCLDRAKAIMDRALSPSSQDETSTSQESTPSRKLTYSVIGTGGIGGYYGGRLAQAGHDVHFLLHTDYEYVKENGLRVDSVNGDFHIDSPHVYCDAGQMPLSDVVLVCLKTTNNHLLPDLLQKVADDHTIVVLIQNGIGVEEDVQKALPNLQLVAGLAFICTAKVGPGHIHHQCYGQINLGNYSCQDAASLNQIAEDFSEAGIPAHLVEYHEARWKKAVWNMPFNGMTVALHTQTDLLLKHPATRRLIREQMMEIVRAAEHLGISGVDEAFVDKMISMTDEMTPYSPSMRLDYDCHRPMEIKYIYSRPLEMARTAGMPMPRLEMLEAELRFLENA